MKLAAFLTIAALVPAYAQLGAMKPPPAPVSARAAGATIIPEKSAVALQTLGTLEKEMDSRLSATGAVINDPSVVLGLTRGLYVNGFGPVFTAEVDLVNSPSLGLFNTINAEEKALVHKRKLAHVQMLQQSMRDVVLSLAASPALKMADSDQIVVAVRLVYRPWEDMTGLPGQIVMRADRRGGAVKMEVQ
jgi:hypothetical protein